jgi:phosphatidylserine/phosphatidylglycerophosphate/cardiolipin synthase-like enzyme
MMDRIERYLLACFAFASLAAWTVVAPAVSGGGLPARVSSVHFSPDGGCTAECVARIAGAKTSVRVLAYSFTSRPIAEALVEAKDRGIDVRVVLDKEQPLDRHSQMPALVEAGVPVKVDHKHAIMHDKVIIVDGRTVLTGSFNFSVAAEEHNAENLLTDVNSPLADDYLANWTHHDGHSEPPRP